MKINKRFIKGIIATATLTEATALPWTRGLRRAAFVAKRNAATQQRKSA